MVGSAGVEVVRVALVLLVALVVRVGLVLGWFWCSGGSGARVVRWFWWSLWGNFWVLDGHHAHVAGSLGYGAACGWVIYAEGRRAVGPGGSAARPGRRGQ